MGDVIRELSNEIDQLEREFLSEGGGIDRSTFHVYRLSWRLDGQKYGSQCVADPSMPFSMWCRSVIEALRAAIRFFHVEDSSH